MHRKVRFMARSAASYGEAVLHQDAAVVPRKYFILSGGTSALERNDPEHTRYRSEWGHPGPVFG